MRTKVYLNTAGKYYAAEVAAHPNDCRLLAPSKEMVIILNTVSEPKSGPEITEAITEYKKLRASERDNVLKAVKAQNELPL